MIEVLKPGLYTSIHDRGRVGYRNSGVPCSGCMDEISANLANALLNNPLNCAVMEITMKGPVLKFLCKTQIVITGAQMNACLNSIPFKNNSVISIQKNDIVSFGKLTKGYRCYLAVSGGILTQKVLNSRSFFKNITPSSTLHKNDILKIKPQPKIVNFLGNIKDNNILLSSKKLEVYRGPEFHFLSNEKIVELLTTTFSISNDNNRMGYRLNEEVFAHNHSIITSPVLPGTVQLIPSGKLIVLMKDAQTTGGYPRIFQLSDDAISVLAQKKAGDKIHFKLI